VTCANDPEGFRRKAEVIAATINMYVADVEGAEPLSQRAEKRTTMTEEIDDMVLRAELNPGCDCLWHVPSLSIR
jgi:hypothetical protein